MISTRVHGAIDWGVSALFGALAAAGPLDGATREVLGAAGLYHGSYAALTDYEAGMAPLLSMRQHLVLDAMGALGLCGAALALRRAAPRERALLLAAGIAELAIVSLSDRQPHTGPGQGPGPLGRTLIGPMEELRAGYPPYDTVKELADGVWIVDAEPLRKAIVPLPLRMTILRLPNGELLVVSPTLHSAALQQEIERLGHIRALVAPSFAHWMFVKDWQRACPGTETLGAPALARRRAVRRSGLRFDGGLNSPPESWRGAIETVRIPGAFGFEEYALLHHPSRTLVLTDLITNIEVEKLPPPLGPLLRGLGMAAPDGRAPAYVRAIVSAKRGEARRAAERLVAFAPERVIFAHGWWFDRDATAKLRLSLRWLGV